MAVFDVAQHVVNASGGIIAGNTAIDASGLEALEETLQGMDLGPLIGLLLQSELYPASYHVCSVHRNFHHRLRQND